MTEQEKTAEKYSAAAQGFDANDFWRHFGEETGAWTSLKSTDILRDVGSGPGAWAIPAARKAERVIGLDIAPGMVKRAQEKATAEGLTNIEFRVADFDQAYFRPATFDAVVCVFGIFFLPD